MKELAGFFETIWPIVFLFALAAAGGLAFQRNRYAYRLSRKTRSDQ